MNCDYILTGGKIYTLDEAKPEADWVAVKDGKILEVGVGPIPDACEIRSFGTHTILPGLIDSHVHGCNTAVMLSGVSLMEATSVAEALALIEERCRNTEEELVFAPFYIIPANPVTVMSSYSRSR